MRGACAIMPEQVIGKHDEGDSQMIQALVEYFALVFEAIGYTLRFDPRVYVEVILHPEGAAIIRGIVFLAGVSMLLGQSLMLFVNRVRRGRFFLSLVINGIVFLITYAVWGICVALIAWLMFDVTLAGLVIVVFLVGLSTATPLPDEARTYGAKTLDTIEHVLTQADLLKSTDPQPSM